MGVQSVRAKHLISTYDVSGSTTQGEMRPLW